MFLKNNREKMQLLLEEQLDLIQVRSHSQSSSHSQSPSPSPQSFGEGILKNLRFDAKKRKRDPDFVPYIAKLDPVSISENMLLLLKALLSLCGFVEDPPSTWKPIHADAITRLSGTSASIGCVNYLLKPKYFTASFLKPKEFAFIDPMAANDYEIMYHCKDYPWAVDDEDKGILPPWALRHKLITHMLQLHDDDKPIRWFKDGLDSRINGYSCVNGDMYDKFTFHIKPKVSMGQRGAGSDGVVKAGAYVTLSFPWQAYMRDQPNQKLMPVHRSV